MRLSLALLILASSSAVAQTSDFGRVQSNDLRSALAHCQNAPNEARCLRRSIQRLIVESERPPISPYQLTCRSGPNGKFAVYNDSNGSFLDKHYVKTADECRQTIEYTYTGLMCSGGPNSKFVVQDIATGKYVGKYFSMSLQDCFTTIQSASEHLCLAGSNGQFARYNRRTGTFLDTNYNMSLETCVDLLP